MDGPTHVRRYNTQVGAPMDVVTHVRQATGLDA